MSGRRRSLELLMSRRASHTGPVTPLAFSAHTPDHLSLAPSPFHPAMHSAGLPNLRSLAKVHSQTAAAARGHGSGHLPGADSPSPLGKGARAPIARSPLARQSSKKTPGFAMDAEVMHAADEFKRRMTVERPSEPQGIGNRSATSLSMYRSARAGHVGSTCVVLQFLISIGSLCMIIWSSF